MSFDDKNYYWKKMIYSNFNNSSATFSDDAGFCPVPIFRQRLRKDSSLRSYCTLHHSFSAYLLPEKKPNQLVAQFLLLYWWIQWHLYPLRDIHHLPLHLRCKHRIQITISCDVITLSWDKDKWFSYKYILIF